jgi:hypothetical protein
VLRSRTPGSAWREEPTSQNRNRTSWVLERLEADPGAYALGHFRRTHFCHRSRAVERRRGDFVGQPTQGFLQIMAAGQGRGGEVA